MAENTKTIPDIPRNVLQALAGVLSRLKAAMDEGPDGPSVTLTASEAALVFRLLMQRK